MKLAHCFTTTLLIGLILLVSACSDEQTGQVEDTSTTNINNSTEPVDEEATDRLEQSLMATLQTVTNDQAKEADQEIEQGFETLSEADRQMFIDNVLERSAKKTEDDAAGLAESLEQMKSIEHAPIEEQQAD